MKSLLTIFFLSAAVLALPRKSRQWPSTLGRKQSSEVRIEVLRIKKSHKSVAMFGAEGAVYQIGSNPLCSRHYGLSMDFATHAAHHAGRAVQTNHQIDRSPALLLFSSRTSGRVNTALQPPDQLNNVASEENFAQFLGNALQLPAPLTGIVVSNTNYLLFKGLVIPRYFLPATPCYHRIRSPSGPAVLQPHLNALRQVTVFLFCDPREILPESYATALKIARVAI
ncbi:hypothetical protein C8F04DRAFT_1200688 [Mycena alexandri]|uniref:Uncharacterized protein n=1 Tax=Mycena alexandri TaxID=1745969 RepID=A0AAD6WKN5_9AGAR|nr:hypothetical protein C8F04DRAFT_1200688 [Mycena alexandri]